MRCAEESVLGYFVVLKLVEGLLLYYLLFVVLLALGEPIERHCYYYYYYYAWTCLLFPGRQLHHIVFAINIFSLEFFALTTYR